MPNNVSLEAENEIATIATFVFVLRRQVAKHYGCLQPGITGLTDDVAHRMALTPANPQLSAGYRVHAHNELHSGPRLTRARHQKLDQSRGALHHRSCRGAGNKRAQAGHRKTHADT